MPRAAHIQRREPDRPVDEPNELDPSAPSSTDEIGVYDDIAKAIGDAAHPTALSKQLLGCDGSRRRKSVVLRLFCWEGGV